MSVVVAVAPRVFLYDDAQLPPRLSEGAIALPVTRSDAFGDGSHPTTRLCARAVDLHCRQREVGALLDVGTGTGVLARLARAHGVPFVVATDIDERARSAACENAALDARGGELVVCDAAPDAFGRRFDVVVANILERVLLGLADALVAALAPRGVLLLSGFTPLQAPPLRAAFTGRGLALDVEARLDEWALLQLQRR